MRDFGARLAMRATEPEAAASSLGFETVDLGAMLGPEGVRAFAASFSPARSAPFVFLRIG
ncbi:MAG TPA: hypothetical protein VGN55_23445 [Xanthobacteraceae bacterium]